MWQERKMMEFLYDINWPVNLRLLIYVSFGDLIGLQLRFVFVCWAILVFDL